MATLLAIEALRRSGEAKYSHELSEGRKRLLALQTDSGAWETGALDASLLTRKIIGHFEESNLAWDNGTVGKLNRSGRAFVEIAKQLIEQGGSENAKMAIVSLVHGLEFQLYSSLSSPDISANIFRKGGQQTIGARDAMSMLREYLIGKGELGTDSTLKFQSQISLMISTRDSVVHKNASVSRSDISHWIKEVESFANLYLRR
ncbi:hypothetical protein [uncultured Ruegeria sp.]|uniref:hypothetical protein n=1 Tax=uncultured Ruegeria sp. TaxID=259304 RepID=UPI00262C4DD9|nr:hypothetical protein [uncultured Ruegeria sp.]